MARIEHLNYAGKVHLMEGILKGVSRELADDLDEETLDVLLEGFCVPLDELSDEDAFGTEGWEHAFGVER